jgi:hypothetical protein
MPTHEIGCLRHCPGGGGGGKGWLLLIAAAAVLVIGAAAYKARHGIETGLNVVATIGAVIMWTVAVAFMLGVATGIGWVGWKFWRAIQAARAARAARPAPLPAAYRITPIANRAPEAIEPARPDYTAGWVPDPGKAWRPAPRQEVDDDARSGSRFR